MKNEIILHIKEDKTVTVDIIENDIITTKRITPKELLDCVLNSTTTMKSLVINSGILPQNAVTFSFKPNDSEKYVVLEFPEEKTNITYEKTEYENFPIPRILFGFHITNSGRISSVRMGVAALGVLSMDTPMYRYPFSNVQGFSLCIGGNEMPHIESMNQLSGLPYYIMSMPDNDDRYSANNNKLKMGHRDLLEHLKDKDRQYYYDNILVPMGSKKLKDFIREENI